MDPDVLAERARRLRDRLLADAHLFPDPTSYRAGVDDAVERLLAALDGEPTHDDAAHPVVLDDPVAATSPSRSEVLS